VELEGLAHEDQTHDSINIKNAPNTNLGSVINKPVGAGFLDSRDEAVDDFPGLVLFGEPHGISGDRLGDIEGLKVAVVVGAREQTLVEVFAGGIQQSFPDGIAFLGGAKGEQAKGGVAKPVFVGFIGEGLGGDRAGRQVDQI
jgi:hypothetical protein